MKLSDFLLFPMQSAKSKRVTLTSYANTAVEDEDTAKYLRMLVDASSSDEVRFILTMLWKDFQEGRLQMDMGMYWGEDE